MRGVVVAFMCAVTLVQLLWLGHLASSAARLRAAAHAGAAAADVVVLSRQQVRSLEPPDPAGDRGCFLESVRAPPPTLHPPLVLFTPEQLNFSLFPHTGGRPGITYHLEDVSAPPMVSVITAFYNAKVFVAVDSVLRSTLQQIEWIIVNDGSTQFLELLAPLRDARRYPRVRVIDLPENRGLPSARNAAIRAARAPYIFNLDTDDIIEPTFLEKALWFLEAHPQFDLVNAWSIGFGYKEYLWAKGFQNGDVNVRENQLTVAMMFRTEAALQVGMFDESLVTGMEDWDLWMRFADRGHWGHTLEEYLFWYRVSPPGKWKAINDPESFQRFLDEFRHKYPDVHINGVPPVTRNAPYMSVVPTAIPFANRLSRSPRPASHEPAVFQPPPPPPLPTSAEVPTLLFIVGGIGEVSDALADTAHAAILREHYLRGWRITLVATKPISLTRSASYTRYTSDLFVLSNVVPQNHEPRFLAYLIGSRRPHITLISESESAYLSLNYLHEHAPDTTYMDYAHLVRPGWRVGGFPRYSALNSPALARSVFSLDASRQWAISVAGHSPQRCATVPLRVQVPDESDPAGVRRAVRRGWGISDADDANALVLMFVGEIEAENLPNVFVSILGALVSEHKIPAMGVIVGTGSFVPSVLADLATLGVLDRVKLLGAVSNPAERARLMRGGDVLVWPARERVTVGAILKLQLAAAVGMIPVSVDVWGMAEVVPPDRGVLVAAELSSSELTRAMTAEIASLHRDPARRKALSSSARSQQPPGGEPTRQMAGELIQQMCAAIRSTPVYWAADDRIAVESARRAVLFEQTQDEVLDVWRSLQVSSSHYTEAPLVPIAANFMQGLMMIAFGATDARPGGSFAVTSMWVAQFGPTESRLQLFVEAEVVESGVLAWRMEHPMQSHGREVDTTKIGRGELLLDSFVLTLPDTVKANTMLKLYVGFSNVNTGDRLPLEGGAGTRASVYVLVVKD